MPAMRAVLAVQGCEVSIIPTFRTPSSSDYAHLQPELFLLQVQAELTFTQTFAYLCLQAVSESAGRVWAWSL